MTPGKDYYGWKVLDRGELYTPHADPMDYEHQFDYLFDSPEQAYQGLRDFDIAEVYWDLDEEPPEDWHPTGWVLVKTRIEVV